MGNLLKEKPDYVVIENRWGLTRKYLYESGMLFREFKTHKKFGGLPLVHITFGKSPETGKRLWARGVIAIGRKAFGVVAIGQMAFGVVAVGQLALGLFLALGQLGISPLFAIGQAAVAGCFAAGQFAIAQIAIGQFAIGYYALGQIAAGKYLFSVKVRNPEAVNFFKSMLESLKLF